MKWLWMLLPWMACGNDGGSEGLDASLDGGFDATLEAAALDGDICNEREQQLPVISAFHVLGDVSYSDPPPVGGDHNPCWAPWGVYDSELADERWVHNLEHGGVVFLYDCAQGCPDEVTTMQAFVDGRTQALLTPYAALPTRFAVVAWGVRLTTNCFDMPAFQQFYLSHVDHAPESIPDDPPRSCR